ncbi:CHAT domain-containing protein [Streptomyces sp. NPDC090046]|uniref:CHAT domain-containing protein n=1 Tax=Streptomyces sp. NPDC090046 TaxID=3365928 RepID=UPI0038303239
MVEIAQDDDVAALHAAAWALFYRSHVLPLAESASDRRTAAGLFARCFLGGADAERLPVDLLDEIVNEAGRQAVPSLREAIRTKDRPGVETQLQLWRRIVGACRESHRHRAFLLTNLAAILQVHEVITDSGADCQEIVDLLERAVRATPEESGERPQRLLNLGVARRRRFGHCGDGGELDKAIDCFGKALDSLEADDPRRRDAYVSLGEAIRVKATRMTFSFNELSALEEIRSRSSAAVFHVCELLNTEDLAQKEEIVKLSPELMDPLALRVLDNLIEDAESLGEDAPLAVPLLRMHRGVLEALQGAAPDPDGGNGPFVPPAAAPLWVAEARSLLDQGGVEEAEALLTGAAGQARTDDDPHAEGHAELALHDLVIESIWPAPGSVDRLDRHAAGAEAAFRRARNRDGLVAALGRRIAVAVQLQDGPMTQDAMQRLLVLDPYGGAWWHTFIRAVVSDDADFCRTQLRWCLDNTWRLGQDAAHYGALCERKLAFLDGRAASEQSGLTGELGALVHRIEREGPAAGDDARLAAALERVEVIRSHAFSDTVQHGLSAVYTPAYEALSRCVAAHSTASQAAEAGVDVLERNSSRALLVRMLTTGAGPQSPPSCPESAQLGEQVSAYLNAPTPQHRALLSLAFDKERGRRRHAEREVMRGAASPSSGPAPVSVKGLQTLLQDDDAVLFFGGTGDVCLITPGRCDRVASFTPRTLAREAASLHTKLAGGSPPDDRPQLALLAGLAPRVRTTVAEGSRLIIVPHHGLWQIPLALLGEERLGEVYHVSTVPSLSVLAELLRRPSTARRAVLTGLGDPDGTLPHARAEVEAAGAHYREARIRTADAATPNAYRADAVGADVVHLACHGFYLPEYPDFAGLQLSGTRSTPGMLWYSDILQTPLTASLVVLGACHAGTGEVLSGAEYVGIPGAFLAAGARSVLAPLWAVDDGISFQLLEAFHAEYVRGGSAAVAFRHAQRALATTRPDRTGTAYAFQLFGLP